MRPAVVGVLGTCGEASTTVEVEGAARLGVPSCSPIGARWSRVGSFLCVGDLVLAWLKGALWWVER